MTRRRESPPGRRLPRETSWVAIEERTEHTVTIQELHAGQVAKVTEVLEATRRGNIVLRFVAELTRSAPCSRDSL